MEGSALSGDMLGGVKPVELSIEIEADAAHEIIVELVKKTEMTSAPQAYMRNVYENTFSLCLKGQQYPVRRVTASPNDLILYSGALFDAVQPLPDSTYETDIITKQSSAATIFDLEGGVGSSLQSEQKRTLHARSVAMLLEDGLKEVVVQLLKPIGSVFRFISDDSVNDGGPHLHYFIYQPALGFAT